VTNAKFCYNYGARESQNQMEEDNVSIGNTLHDVVVIRLVR
jgi:hypothetical protein